VEVGYNTVSSSIVEEVMGDPAYDMGGQKLFCDLCTVFIISQYCFEQNSMIL